MEAVPDESKARRAFVLLKTRYWALVGRVCRARCDPTVVAVGY